MISSDSIARQSFFRNVQLIFRYSSNMKIRKFSVFLILLCSFDSSFCLTFRIGNQKRRQTVLERFDNTCGLRNLTIIFNYSNMISNGNYLAMNSTIVVKQDIPGELGFTIRLERCQNKENLDTCEHFHDYKTEKFCTILSSNSPLWAPIFSAFEPKPACPPFKKDVYRAINSTVDVSAFLLFPTDSWYWRVKVEITDKVTKKMHLCLKAEAHVIAK